MNFNYTKILFYYT